MEDFLNLKGVGVGGVYARGQGVVLQYLITPRKRLEMQRQLCIIGFLQVVQEGVMIILPLISFITKRATFGRLAVR